MSGRMLLFCGDSCANGTRAPDMLGWCGRLARSLAAHDHAVTSYNLGIRGETLPELAERMPDELVRRQRSDLAPLIIVSAGTNDTSSDGGGRRVSGPDSLAALRRIIATARCHAPLLVVGPPALPDPVQSSANRDLSIRMAGRCAEEGVPFVETWGGSRAADVWIRERAEDDGFDPRAEGYRAMADMIRSTGAWRGFAGLACDEERPAALHGGSCASSVRSRSRGASRRRDEPRPQAIIWAFEALTSGETRIGSFSVEARALVGEARLVHDD